MCFIIVSRDISIERVDFEFVVEYYTDEIMGLITLWLDNNMDTPATFTRKRLLRMLDNSMEQMLARFSDPNR